MKRATWERGAVAFMVALVGFLASGRPAQAEDEASKLSVHGFLTQAYGRMGDDQEPYLGLTERGTTDYRTAALQFGYALTDKDRLVIQLSHERIGVDDAAAFLPDVALDWAFYEHKFSEDTRLRVGRLQMPVGIYNEIRDVGTLLPFYRPPVALYAEVEFATETVDGIAASHTFHAGKWGLEINPFYGGWDTIGRSQAVGEFQTRTFDAFGASAWILTPVEGVRVGGAALHSKTDLGETTETDTTYRVMADASFSKVTVRGEYFKNSDDDTNWTGWYGLVTVRPTEKLALNVQYTRSDLDFVAGFFNGRSFIVARDTAASVNYSFRPNVAVKLEGHDGKGAGVFQPSAPDATYGIASLSVSF